jgi:UDP-2,4-diacetamido-2,4,6-trideoxy-beta-L-altropyranose hydrolase
MRCITLAKALAKEGAEVLFICRELAGHLCDYLESQRFSVARLPAPEGPVESPVDEYSAWLGVSQQWDAEQSRAALDCVYDWLIVDHYGLDQQWLQSMRAFSQQLLVIDDLANRPLLGDILLNQNLRRDSGAAYDPLLPAGCRRLLGPEYALLRPEFAALRSGCLPRKAPQNRVLVFIGGSDAPNVSARAIDALAGLAEHGLTATVIAGKSNATLAQLEQQCAPLSHVEVFSHVEDMAAQMVAADVAIGAGGTTTWERFALGLPSILVTLAENQRGNCDEAHRLGAAICLGDADQVTPEMIAAALRRLLADPGQWRQMSQTAAGLVDGGGTQRVINAMLGRRPDTGI